jgi:hypothetical protein
MKRLKRLYKLNLFEGNTRTGCVLDELALALAVFDAERPETNDDGVDCPLVGLVLRFRGESVGVR